MDGLSSPAIPPVSPKAPVDPAEFVALQAIVQVLTAVLANLAAGSGEISASDWVREITTMIQGNIQRATMPDRLREGALENVERILGGISFGQKL
jgi:hypothetical protein